MLYLPSYAATAFYYKKLPPELEKSLEVTLRKRKDWLSALITKRSRKATS